MCLSSAGGRARPQATLTYGSPFSLQRVFFTGQTGSLQESCDGHVREGETAGKDALRPEVKSGGNRLVGTSEVL